MIIISRHCRHIAFVAVEEGIISNAKKSQFLQNTIVLIFTESGPYKLLSLKKLRVLIAVRFYIECSFVDSTVWNLSQLCK